MDTEFRLADCDWARMDTEFSLGGGSPTKETAMHAIQIPLSEQRNSRATLRWPCATTVLAAALTVGFASVGITTPTLAQEKMTTPAPAEAKPNIMFIMGDEHQSSRTDGR